MKHLNTIKRFGAILLCLTLALCLSSIAVSADDAQEAELPVNNAGHTEEVVKTEPAEETPAVGDVTTIGATETTVFLTIADENGDLAVAMEPVTVTDIDGDGALTVNDALYGAHEKYYEGGAAAGYASAQSDYGLSLVKLWGAENGGSYGYYVNDAAAWSLTDPVADGDRVSAFVYTDLTAWSDTYCYFSEKASDAETDGTKELSIPLTLSMAGFDADWNPVTLPVAGATITVDGRKTSCVTDENGRVTLQSYFTEAGTYLISAVSDTQTLVPPVYKLTVTLKETDKPKNTPIIKPDPEIAPVAAATAPETGDAGSYAAGIVLLGALCAAGLTLSLKRREK